MREFRARPWREYFRKPEASEAWAAAEFGLPAPIRVFYRYRHLFRPLSFSGFFLITGVLLSIEYRWARVPTLAWALFLMGLYYRTRALAEGLYVYRQVPRTCVEKSWLQVKFEIRNASQFSVTDLLIKDRFTGSLKPDASVSIDDQVSGFSVYKGNYRVFCDAGMGPHQFGPLELELSDPLGIFEFTVCETEKEKIEILPEFISIPEFRAPTSIDSTTAGVLDGVTQGQSSNFLGVREYRPGDPLKKIHWKLSAKHRELVVKEFENVINSDLTICLEMDQREHLGQKSLSTWEYAKDITLSLIQEKLANIGRIQLISQGVHIPFGQGSDHCWTIIQRVSSLKPLNAGRQPHLLEKAWAHSPYGSSVLYISPIYQSNPEQMGRMMESLKAKAVRMGCVFIPGAAFTESVSVHPAVMGGIAEKNREAEDTLACLLVQNAFLGVKTYVVRKGESISARLSIPSVGG